MRLCYPTLFLTILLMNASLFSCETKNKEPEVAAAVSPAAANKLHIYSDDWYDSKWTYNHRGNVKSMVSTIIQLHTEPEKNDTAETKVWFDGQARIMRLRDRYDSTEYYYERTNDDRPQLITSFRDKKPYQYRYAAYTTEGQPLIECDMSAEPVRGSSIFFYDYHKGSYERFYFTDSAQVYGIDSIRVSEGKGRVNGILISKELIPFEPEATDSILEKNSYDFYTIDRINKPEQNRTYIVHKKKEPDTWIEINFKKEYDDWEADNWLYFEHGLLMKDIPVTNSLLLSYFGTVYTYNKEGRLISKRYDSFRNPGKEDYYSDVLSAYDTLGNRISVIRKDYKKSEQSDRIVYSYDTRGNWTEAKKYSYGKLIAVFRRKIDYYQPGATFATTDINTVVKQGLMTVVKEYIRQCNSSLMKFKTNVQQLGTAYSPDLSRLDAIRSDNWKDFMLSQWKLDTAVSGDLNGDHIPDLVFVASAPKLGGNTAITKRIITILLKDSANRYHHLTSSLSAIATEFDNNIYFSGIAIKKGILIVEHEYIRGGCTQKYRYQNGNIYLIGYNSITGDAASSESTDYNLITGERITEHNQYLDENDEPVDKKKVDREEIKPRQLLTIAATPFADYEPRSGD